MHRSGFATKSIAAIAILCYLSAHAERVAVDTPTWRFRTKRDAVAAQKFRIFWSHMPGRTTVKSTRSKSRPATKKRAVARRPSRKPSPGDAADTAFIEALSVDFQQYGASAIARVRQDDPVTYMKLCASVLPKSVIDSLDPLDSLTDEELRKRARDLAEKAGIGPRPNAERAGETSES